LSNLTMTAPNQNPGPAAQSDYHNVIILGAGASADAGIPLLAPFLETMWEYAARRKVHDKDISPADVETLKTAIGIQNSLERYNSRASFDIRNLEDVLSLLSFEALAGGPSAEKYNAVVKAVARTVELSCLIRFDHCTGYEPIENQSNYNVFWTNFLTEAATGNLPALITFNYDLVLERALWQFVRVPTPIPARNGVAIRYSFGNNRLLARKKNGTTLLMPRRDGQTYAVRLRNQEGHTSVHGPSYVDPATVECTMVPYFKLHGSLNWMRDECPETEIIDPHPLKVSDTPVILPPVFNKMNTTALNEVWTGALDVLRRAKNIIIVGYSLPKTDIYMQYFLKAAVGANSDLRKILIFNPALFKNDKEAGEMRKRYEDCFAPQFSNRLVFDPRHDEIKTDSSRGTFLHFVHSMRTDPDELFFRP
jgi:SIR2-like domain